MMEDVELIETLRKALQEWTAEGQEEGAPYLATTGAKAYAIHRPWCRWAPPMGASYTLAFNSLGAARRATGKVPCDTCIGR